MYTYKCIYSRREFVAVLN